MGANTTYYVNVLKTVDSIITVQAVTADEAEQIAKEKPGVIAVSQVRHCSEVRSAGCGG